MIYQTRSPSIVGKPWREITKERYDELRAIDASLDAIAHIEEAYDVVLGNFIELEELVASLAIRNMSGRGPIGQPGYHDATRRECHRVVANLLSSARGFVDQTKSAINRTLGSDAMGVVSVAISEQYDTRLGYRFMDGLRNYSQHAGFSVTSVHFGQKRIPLPDGRFKLGYSVDPVVLWRDLRGAEKINKKLLAELSLKVADDDDGKFYIVPFARDYLAGLSNVLGIVRQLVSDPEKEWAANLHREKPDDYVPTDGYGLSFYIEELADDRRVVKRQFVGVDPNNIVKILREANRDLDHLVRAIVQQ